MPTPKVVVATLTWNQKSDVLECLSTLVKLDYPHYEIVVVDNGSTDGTSEAVQRQYPGVHLVRHPENFGCAEGVNGEIRYALQAGADYLFIIANDAVVEPSTLTELVKVAERDPKIGIVSPKVYHYGSKSRIWFAGGARFDWVRGRFHGFFQNVEDDGSFDEEQEAEFFPGGFSLVRTEAIKRTGFLDPDYFIYFDDSDWSLRIHRAGYSGRYAPRSRAWHKPSSALGMETEGFYYYRARNRLFFVAKYAPFVALPIFFAYFFYELVFETLPCLFRSGSKAQLRAVLVGIADFFRGKRGGRTFEEKRKSPQINTPTKQGLSHKPRMQVSIKWKIGDEIMALPAYEALKKDYPQTSIDAEVNYPELLKGNPFVDSVNGGEGVSPDRVIDLHQEARERPRRDFLREITGVRTWGEPKVYLDPEELEVVRKRWELQGEALRIGISPSADWFSRQWPRENWCRLAEYFIRRFKARVFVLGKHEESLPVGIDLIGKTNLREAAALLNQFQLYVGSDSGLVHLAVAVGTPTVGLFGPLNPALLIPERPHFLPIWTEVECRGCWPDYRMRHRDHCPKVSPDCMTSIPVSRVIEASEKFLSRICVPG